MSVLDYFRSGKKDDEQESSLDERRDELEQRIRDKVCTLCGEDKHVYAGDPDGPEGYQCYECWQVAGGETVDHQISR